MAGWAARRWASCSVPGRVVGVADMLVFTQLSVVAVQEGGGAEKNPQKQKCENIGLDAEGAGIHIQLHTGGDFGGIHKGKQQKGNGSHDQGIGPYKRDKAFTARLGHLFISHV